MVATTASPLVPLLPAQMLSSRRPAALEELTWALSRPPYHARPTPPPCRPCRGRRRVKGQGPSRAGRRERHKGRVALQRPRAARYRSLGSLRYHSPALRPGCGAATPLPDISGTASPEPGPVSVIPGVQLPWVAHWSSLAALGNPAEWLLSQPHLEKDGRGMSPGQAAQQLGLLHSGWLGQPRAGRVLKLFVSRSANFSTLLKSLKNSFGFASHKA